MSAGSPPAPRESPADRVIEFPGGHDGRDEGRPRSGRRPSDDEISPAEPPRLNLRTFTNIARYVREQHGPEHLELMAERAEVSVEALARGTDWIELRQAEALLSDLRAMVADEAEFLRACSYRLADGYGPLRLLLQAAQPRFVFQRATHSFHMVSNFSRYEASFPTNTSCVAHYYTQAPESRLMCLSRQAHMAALPTLWDLPPAHIEEESCVARGDERCTYRLRWYAGRSWAIPLLGAALGTGAAALASTLGLASVPTYGLLPIVGFLAAEVWHLRRRNRINLAAGAEISASLRSVLEDNELARREILELHQRQRQWAKLLEQQVRERTTQLETVLERVEQLGRHRDASYRGMSHDLRNPLAVLQMATGILEDTLDPDDPAARDALELHRNSVEQLKVLVEDLMERATSHLDTSFHEPRTLEVEPLVAHLRRRLHALLHGRNVRTSCFSTRETPDTICCHPVIFDRIVDNLLTNAARHTRRGSIVVEFDGTPTDLVLKVSDTGCGIEPERLEHLFDAPDPSASVSRETHGVGLSVVVDLLDQLGGRLEVMSKPGVGTTFWAYFPVHPKTRDAAPEGSAKPPQAAGSVVDRVVVIHPPEWQR